MKIITPADAGASYLSDKRWASPRGSPKAGDKKPLLQENQGSDGIVKGETESRTVAPALTAQQLVTNRRKNWILKGKFIEPGDLKDSKVLGKGAFGTVHKSLFTNKFGEQVEVAVKRMHPDLVKQSPLEVKNFIEECRMMAAIDHRSIVGYIGAGVSLDSALHEDETPGSNINPSHMFCVQELCDGGSLRELLEKQMGTFARNLKVYTALHALEWTIQIAEALAYLHGGQRPIIHRDLKLDNVMLARTVMPDKDPRAFETPYRAKLADFGLSKRIGVLDEHVKTIRESDGSIRDGSVAGRILWGGSNDGSVKGGNMWGGSNDGSVKGGNMWGGNDGMMTIVEGQPSYSSESKSAFHPARESAEFPAKPMQRRVTFNDKKVRRSTVTNILMSVARSAPSITPMGAGIRTGKDAAAAAAAPAAKELTQKTGSFTYMAPEVFLGTEYDSKVDVFSLGVIMFELFTGLTLAARLMIAGHPQEFENHAIRTAQGHRLDIPKNIPPEVNSCISQLWLQEHSMRPSAEEAVKMLKDLRPVVEEYQTMMQMSSGGCCG